MVNRSRVKLKAVLSTRYSRNQLDLCPPRLLTDCDIDTEKLQHLVKLSGRQSRVVIDSFNATVALGRDSARLSD
ncbi:hypothetical protein DPMN_186301 [Dreissena polymorpha]|uniref:Uncharacterized protein n=1 Tax=Dreissena polymorpha TaxID=45954 RepID=A0A9D4DPF1_DREPO|nr:hypothetical protein DPMN_186301 [Dreissena polymorpha]